MGRHREGPFKVYPREDSDVLWVRFWIAGEEQPRRVPTGERDRERAEERAAEIWQEAKARAGDSTAPADAGVELDLASYGARLVEEVKTLGRADTYARDLKIDLKLHICSRWRSPGAVTTVDWEEHRLELHKAGQSWASVKRVGKHLRLLLRYCLRKGALMSVPEIKSPEKELIAREQAETAGMPKRDRDAMLAWYSKKGLHRTRRLYEVMFFNLFRKSSVQRILPTWISFRNNTITIPASSAKNSKTRVYWLHSRAKRAFREQLAENERKSRRYGKKANGTVALNEPIFGKFDCSTQFWTACKALGLVTVQPAVYAVSGDGEQRRRRLVSPERITDKRGLTPHHVARRSAATMLVDAGVSTKDRMAAGGWDSIEAAESYDKPKDQIERSRRALEKLK